MYESWKVRSKGSESQKATCHSWRPQDPTSLTDRQLATGCLLNGKMEKRKLLPCEVNLLWWLQQGLHNFVSELKSSKLYAQNRRITLCVTYIETELWRKSSSILRIKQGNDEAFVYSRQSYMVRTHTHIPPTTTHIHTPHTHQHTYTPYTQPKDYKQHTHQWQQKNQC